MKGFVYILYSPISDRYYVGSTSNIQRRLFQHLCGYSHSTRRMKEMQLALVQEYESLLQARRVERRIKDWKNKKYIDRIVREGKIRIR